VVSNCSESVAAEFLSRSGIQEPLSRSLNHAVANWEVLRRLNADLVILLARDQPYAAADVSRVWGGPLPPLADNCIATLVQARGDRKGHKKVLISAPNEHWLTDEIARFCGLATLPERPSYRYVTRYAIVTTDGEQMAKAFLAREEAPEYVWAPAEAPHPALAAAQTRTLVVLVNWERMPVAQELSNALGYDFSRVKKNEVAFWADSRRDGLWTLVIVAPNREFLLRAIEEYGGRRAEGVVSRAYPDLREVRTIRFVPASSQPGAARLSGRVLEGLKQLAQAHGIAVVEQSSPADLEAKVVAEVTSTSDYWIDITKRTYEEEEAGEKKVHTLWSFVEWRRDEVSVSARLDLIDPRAGQTLLSLGSWEGDSDSYVVQSGKVTRAGTEQPEVPFRRHYGPEPAPDALLHRVIDRAANPLAARLEGLVIWPAASGS